MKGTAPRLVQTSLLTPEILFHASNTFDFPSEKKQRKGYREKQDLVKGSDKQQERNFTLRGMALPSKV